MCNDKCFAGGYCGVDSATLAPAVGAGLEGSVHEFGKVFEDVVCRGEEHRGSASAAPQRFARQTSTATAESATTRRPAQPRTARQTHMSACAVPPSATPGSGATLSSTCAPGSSITIVNGQAGTPDTFNVVATGTCEDAGNESITSDTECQVAGNNAAVNSKFHTWFVEWEHNIADDLNNCNTPTNFPNVLCRVRRGLLLRQL